MKNHRETSFHSYIACRLPGIIFLIWTYALLWLVHKDRYRAFLQPVLLPFLITGSVITAIFCVASLLRKPAGHSCSCGCSDHHSSLKNTVIYAMVILLPLFFLFTVYGESLGTFAFKRRSYGVESHVSGLLSNSTDTSTNKADASSDLSEEPTPIHVILSNWQEYEGKEVTIEGAVMKNDLFQPNQCLVFRFLIQCCAADARPIGIIVFSDMVEPLKNDAWVRVTGTFNIQHFESRRVAAIHSAIVEELPQPPVEKRYVYPF